jgi:Tol biopolymer transport system component
VRISLAKDPDDRWQTARDVALQLQEIGRERERPETPHPPARARTSRLLTVVSAIAALVVGVLLGRVTLSRATKPGVVQSAILPPPNARFYFADVNSGTPAVSPDGTRVAFSAQDAYEQVSLWVRPLASPDAFEIRASSAARFPFWSPDGRSLGFFAQGKLKVVEASSSALPVALADVEEAKGGAWGADGTILFSVGYQLPLMRIPSSGGTPKPVTEIRRRENHRWPAFLPDGRHFLYSARVPVEEKGVVYLGSLDSKEIREVLPDNTDALYVPPGYLLFRRNGSLMAARFDPARLEIVGEPIELVGGVDYFPATGHTTFGASEKALVYEPASDAALSRLVWFDRTGREVGGVAGPGMYVSPRLSPGGRQLAVSVMEELAIPPDIWLFDTRLGTGTRSPLPFPDLDPVFSPDGQRIFFGSTIEGRWNVFVRNASGTGQPVSLLPPTRPRYPCDVSPDGSTFLYQEFSPVTRGDLKVLSLLGERRPRDFLAGPFEEEAGTFSPDGRQVAYVSDESGRKEVFVASFSDPSRRVRVSSDGGSQPRWSRDGRELFFVSKSETMMAVSIEPATGVPTSVPRRLFDAPIAYALDSHAPLKYDVSPDGRFLIVVRASRKPPPPLVLVLNWQERLAK